MKWVGLLVGVAIVGAGRTAAAQDEGMSQEAVQTSETTTEPQASPTEPMASEEEQAAAEAPSPTGLISVDFKDADIRQVLRIISLKSGVDIVAGSDVEGLVTIKLTDVPWEQALDIILRTYGFTYERKDRIVRVMTIEALEQEALSTEVFPLNYAKAEEVPNILEEMLSDRGKVKFDERTNTVIVTDIPSSLFRIKQVIERIDQQTPQVHIESKIIETKLTRDDNLGIDWFDSATLTLDPAIIPTTFPYPAGGQLGDVGNVFVPRAGEFDPSTGASLAGTRVPVSGGKFTFGTLDTGTLSVTLNALKQRVNTNIISNPTIITLDNKEAIVQVGEDINIPNFQIDPSTGRATVSGFQTRSTGVILKVTPSVNQAQEIVLDLKPEITEVGSTFDTFASGIQFPRFTVQKAQTQVRLKSGQTLVIGGLVKRKTVITKNKIPVLGDLPVVGLLFTNEREQTDPHQDLLIFLTVRLVDESFFQSQQQTAMTSTP
jgi:type IV pilus assembly protein PilQ